jgi:hypothetical protein
MLRRLLSASSSSASSFATISTSSSPLLTSGSPSSAFVCSAALVDASRGGKTRKRPKIGAQFVKDSQKWREDYQSNNQRLLADTLRAYVSYSTTRRIVPWDPRFAPFDREENDGVHAVMRYLMKDKMEMSKNHAHVVKRLMANVGLIGPQVTTKARWRSIQATRMSDRATTTKEYVSEREKGIPGWRHD